MLAHRWKFVLVSGVILSVVAACSFTTANISSLKTFKDEEGKTETSTFQPGDIIYAQATLSNVPSKITLKWQMVAEKVEGNPENTPVPGSDFTLEMPESGTGHYKISPQGRGWPPGSYRIELAMLIESGEQKDQETIKFTVERGIAQTSATASAPDTSQPTGDTKASSIKLTRLRLTSDLKTDFDAPSESTFAPGDHVYVVYTAENVPAGGKILCNLYAEKVEGIQSGENLRLLSYSNPTSDKLTENFDLDPTKSSGEVWDKGTYRVVLRSGPDAGLQQLGAISFTVE